MITSADLTPEQTRLIRGLEKTAAIHKAALEDMAIEAWNLLEAGVPRNRVLYTTGLPEYFFRRLMSDQYMETLYE